MSRGGKKKGSERTLTQELAAFLSKVLVPDLRERAKAPEVRGALEKRYLHEKAANRTAEHFVEWVERTVEQVGAAWVLSCLFIRTLEDRELLSQRRLAGPGAKDGYGQFIELAPALTARDYLLLVFREVASLPVAEDVLGPRHNPAWRLSPSHEAARKLLDFFQEEDAGGALKWTFTGTDTRFLGDIYQDLSEEVRKRYALLQTPHFVENFILDLTLEPAIEEFGLEKVKLIDPTCGSGHFLLGAFERLFEKRRLKAPGLDVKEHAQAALAQVYGVDLNPYAVAIARFRLTLAFLEKGELGKLAQAPRLPLNLVVADSLLYGGRHQRKLSDLDEDRSRWGDELFDLEDPEAARRVFKQRYHAVVGNPPYITCKDAALREAYRDRYDSCYREYALAAPFTERFFELAVESGFVGLINANSFMKREFGRRLIETVLPRYDMTRVVDASGAYIPGHGTPTVLLFGRNRQPVADTVDAVLGKRGEPFMPEDPKHGKVWSSIVSNYAASRFENEFISVTKVERNILKRHPWSLGGGGVGELKERLEAVASTRLGDLVESIGFGCITKQDDVFSQKDGVFARAGCEEAFIRKFVIGEHVRDWSIQSDLEVVFPYDEQIKTMPLTDMPRIQRFLWPYREVLFDRKVFGGSNFRTAGRPWHEYGQIPPDRYQTPWAIAFAFVTTHNHFVLDRSGKVFNRSAPIIKLSSAATEEDYLALLGYLNSSTACFWMKQVFHPKYGAEKQDHPDPARYFYEFTGMGLEKIPLPSSESLRALASLANEIGRLARERQTLLGYASFKDWVGHHPAESLEEYLHSRWDKADRLRERMVLLQEEIDWLVYVALGLVAEPEDVCLPQTVLADGLLPRGQRPFEQVFGRTSLVRRDGQLVSPDVAEMPSRTPFDHRLESVWERRKALLQAVPELKLIETPVFKRLWRDTEANVLETEFRSESHREQAQRYLLDAAEDVLKYDLRPRSVGELCREIEKNPSAAIVLEYLKREFLMDAAGVLASVLSEQAVPFVASYRFNSAGIEKRLEWEKSWELQRREDAGDAVAVPVPPRYESNDYSSATFWRLRGKLDLPTERFISYVGAEQEPAMGTLLGWAGWGALERATALASLYQERKGQDAWGRERLAPLLAGLLELVPWLQQWHNEPNPDFNGERLGDYYAQFVAEEARALGLSLDDLRNWRPVKAPAKKRTAKKKTSASGTEDAA